MAMPASKKAPRCPKPHTFLVSFNSTREALEELGGPSLGYFIARSRQCWGLY